MGQYWPIYGPILANMGDISAVVILEQLDLLNIKKILFAELEVCSAPMCLAASLFITVATKSTFLFLGVLTCRDLPLDEFIEQMILSNCWRNDVSLSV